MNDFLGQELEVGDKVEPIKTATADYECITTDVYGYRCSACGFIITSNVEDDDVEYCPYCGARLL